MKRWLIFVGLLVVCHVDLAVAASSSPSLLQRILSVFHLQSTTHHAGRTPDHQAAQKSEAPEAKPAQTPVETAAQIQPTHPAEATAPFRAAMPVGASPLVPAAAVTAATVQPIRATPPLETANPAPIGPSTEGARPAKAAQPPVLLPPAQGMKAAEKAPARPAARPETNPKRDQAAETAKTAKLAKAAQPVPAASPVRTAQAVEATQSVYSVASLGTVPSVLSRPEPAQPSTPATQSKNEPAGAMIPQASRSVISTPTTQVVQPAERQSRPDQGAQVVRETKSDRAAQPMQVAILGAPNLKAALPDEGVAPVEPPRSNDGPAKPESKSACNGGRRIVSAYYWEGRHTASGQPFNPHGMTAAHRTLPFGTRLDVTNPRTGKTVNVLINDRGPYVRGVSLDLSLGAAQAIGLHGTGSVCIL
jgi:rare lipoprotein A